MRTYPHGVPSWVDTEQPDVAAACDFYGGLLGGRSTTIAARGAKAPTSSRELDGREVAGIAPTEAGQPVAWNAYVAVDDANATAAAIALGRRQR